MTDTTTRPRAARDTLTAAADRLDGLLAAATPRPWTVTEASGRYGGIVGPARPDTRAAEVEGYGGELLGESMTPANRALIVTLGAMAGPFARLLRESVDYYDAGEPFAAGDPVIPLVEAILGEPA